MTKEYVALVDFIKKKVYFCETVAFQSAFYDVPECQKFLITVQHAYNT